MAQNKGGLKYRYGICQNEGCEMHRKNFKKMEDAIQRVEARRDFVCEKCGKPLTECRRPKTTWEKYGNLIIGGIVVAVIAIVGLLFGLGVFGGSDKPKELTTEPDTTTVVAEPQPTPADTTDAANDEREQFVKDSLERVAMIKDSLLRDSILKAKEQARIDSIERAKNTTKPSGNPTYGTVNLGYGQYKGDLKNGKPHGRGTITYTRSHKIVASQDYVASPGDTYEGEFRNGVPSGGPGYWHHNGTPKYIMP